MVKAGSHGRLRVVQGRGACVCNSCPRLPGDFHTYTRSEGVAGSLALVHTPGGGPEANPRIHLTGRASSVSTEGRCLEHRPSAFSPSDSKPTRGVISRTAEARLCPIHTTSCGIGVLDRISPRAALLVQIADQLRAGPPHAALGCGQKLYRCSNRCVTMRACLRS